jgi:Fe-S-cluster containining protein
MASQLAIDDLDLFERRFVRKVGLRRSLVEYADGDCIFLEPETKRCLVYAARPRQCRTWPFWTTTVESPQSWARTARSCPGCNQGRLYQLCEIQNILTKDAEASR